MVLLGVADVVEDDQVEAVELGERRFKVEVAAGGLELLREIGGAGVEDAPADFDERVGDCAEDVGLSGAAVADGDQVGAGLDPVAGGERLDAGAGTLGKVLKSKVASVLPPGRRDSIRCRRMRRVSRSAISSSASTRGNTDRFIN